MFITRLLDSRRSWASGRGRDPREGFARRSPDGWNPDGIIRSTCVGYFVDRPHGRGDRLGCRLRRDKAAAGPVPNARVVPEIRGNPAPTKPAMDPAMQQLLDRARQPHADWDKMTPSVQDAVRSGTGSFRVAILTDDVNTLGTFLRTHGVPTLIGSVPATRTGLRVVTIDVPVRLLEKVAALDRVYVIAPAVLPPAPDRISSGEPGGNRNGGTNPPPVRIPPGRGHHVPEAWALGYTGYGVQVSTMDSGTDFGHPDLQGTFARNTNASSPFF